MPGWNLSLHQIGKIITYMFSHEGLSIALLEGEQKYAYAIDKTGLTSSTCQPTALRI
ncbi:hypothetical protein [Spirosoma gilvum]